MSPSRPVRPALHQLVRPLLDDNKDPHDDSASSDYGWRPPIPATPSKTKFTITQLRRRGWVLRTLLAVGLVAICTFGSGLYEPQQAESATASSGRIAKWKQVLSAVSETTWAESLRFNADLSSKVDRLLHGSHAEAAVDQEGGSLFVDLEVDDASVSLAASPTAELDLATCGQVDCQFLVAAYVAEQQAKASLHLGQLATLARTLNRTLVLPRVSLGRYRSCNAHPFESYYDLDGFRDLFGVRAVTWETFESYVRQRAELTDPVDALHIEVMRTKKRAYSLDPLEAIPDAEDAQCLADLPFASSDVIGYQLQGTYNPDGADEFRFALTEEIVDTLSKNETLSQTSALILTWRLQFRMFPSPTGRPMGKQEADPLPLSKDIQALADETAERLGPYAVLHWRMEEVDRIDSAMPDYVRCAEEAIRTIGKLEGINSIFFATDFPLLGYERPHSDTFVVALKNDTELVQATTAGMDRLLAGFGNTALVRTPLLQRRSRRRPKYRRQSAEPLEVYLTTQHIEGPRLKFSDTDAPTLLEDYDSGMTGVFDRLMAERAAYYITGEPRICARLSNFAVQIINERRIRQEREDSGIVSLIDYFGKPYHGYRIWHYEDVMNPSNGTDARRK